MNRMWSLASPSISIRLQQNFPRQQCTIVASSSTFPAFLPKEIHKINDPYAMALASRIQRLPVELNSSGITIMSSVVKTLGRTADIPPLLLLHGFDSSCLEWRYALPLLEDSGLECWAVDVLGWGFSDLQTLPPCDVASKRDHLFHFWKTHINRPVVVVGPSLGAAVAIDFATNHPQAVESLVLIDASVYTTGKESQAAWAKALARVGVSVLRSVPLRYYAIFLAYKELSLANAFEQMKVGRLHCLYPWWEQATVDFMMNGGYNVIEQITKVTQRTCIIWGENDRIIEKHASARLRGEIKNSVYFEVPNCGHLPHVEKPGAVVKLIEDFIRCRMEI